MVMQMLWAVVETWAAQGVWNWLEIVALYHL